MKNRRVWKGPRGGSVMVTKQFGIELFFERRTALGWGDGISWSSRNVFFGLGEFKDFTDFHGLRIQSCVFKLKSNHALSFKLCGGVLIQTACGKRLKK